MPDYKKLYAFLVGKIDDNLTRLENLKPTDVKGLKEVYDSLQEALLTAEDWVIDED